MDDLLSINSAKTMARFISACFLVTHVALCVLFWKTGVCGGFTGAKKIAAVAEAHHKSLVPHNPCSPVMTNAVLQFVAARA